MKSSCNFVKQKHSKRKILFVVLFILFSVIAAVAVFIKHNVTPMILTLSEERVRSLTADAVSLAVVDVMSASSDVEYLEITRDDEQNIQSVSVDGKTVTVLAEKIALLAQEYITDVGTDGIKIPLGSLSGMSVLTGLGPDINMRVYLVGSTRSQMTSVFTSTGINQTLHRLYFTIYGNIALAVPGIPSTLKVSAEVLMCETLIVGKVPPTYLQSTTVGDMLDLAVR
ncbi:MAG: sporulation protein YunB [Clostridiales bacterium]|nr:sporulation protein YunB [Clostridiales bacterium]